MDVVLTETQAEEYVHGVCFKTGPPGRVGVELEWLVHDRADRALPVPATRLDGALGAVESAGGLPHGSKLTREPGGQVELSTRSASTLADCVRSTAVDLNALREALAPEGLELTGHGLEPRRDPARLLDHPRYRAMEQHFDALGPWGRMMMRATASVQINLDSGDDSDGITGYRRRWALAHRLGPVLVAAFANSPLWQGRPTGWRSTRQWVWANADPDRTRPPQPQPPQSSRSQSQSQSQSSSDADPRGSWARYALDAPLLCLRRTPPESWAAPRGLSFRSWLRGDAAERPPTLGDLDYHLTTLFPPVRARGWLELRMVDAQDGDGWIVPAVLAATLLDDPAAAEAAWAATEPLCTGGSTQPTAEVWLRAARLGPADPAIGEAARACFAAAEAALTTAPATSAPATTASATTVGADPGGLLRDALSAFALRYTEQGRCPADDLLEGLDR
ncbi:ergothioneine biosynthesis glutamate--cysteine ligase EgtA [Streptacidiphilus sp. EB129]|uniref:ergothioneine biosynthesis glutamate--cysteine ligase EgtA n=1 Tax=Streptacidiphilus sp. EB129 TaxID=3156262 RepID=UPI003513B636